MPKSAKADALREKVVAEFQSDWKDKVAAKQAKMGEVVAALARKHGRSTVSIRIYLSRAGLTNKRPRGRKPGRPPMAAALRGNPVAQLLAVDRKIRSLEQRVARLKQNRAKLLRALIAE